MPIFPDHYAINLYIRNDVKRFSRRILSQVPSFGETLVFNKQRYRIHSVEWCLDYNATNREYQALINIEMIKAMGE